MASLFTSGRFQAFDSSGNPLSFGKLCTYAAGTLTPLATYATQAGDVPNAVELALDAAGRASVWLGPYAYRVILKSAAGVTITDDDNISPYPGEQVTFTASGSGAVTRSVQDKLRETVSVLDFGADPTGAADSTAEFQAAIDSLGGNPGVIMVPPGTYLINSTVTMAYDRQWLIGAGHWCSVIRFAPTVADICIFIGKGGEGTTDGGVIYETAVKNITFRSTNTTLKKTAIEIKDGSLTQIEDIHIGGSTRWSGASSVGVRTRGRDTFMLRNSIIECSLPVVIGYNDNFPTICADHFRFENLQLATRAHLETPPNYATAVVTCEPGITLSNTSFSGYQAWLRGRHGFYYDNSGTAAAGASYGVVFENVRWEGEPGDDDTGYCFYIDHGSVSTINNVRIMNMQAGEIGNGVYLRNFLNADLESCNWQIGARVALNIASNNGAEVVRVSNCVWTTGCTATIPSAFFLYAALAASNSAPVVRTGEYSASTTRRDFYSGGAINEFSVTVAAADPTVITLPLRSTATVVGILADSRGKYAIVGFNASSKATTLIYNDTNWSVALDTAAKLNVYWDAGSSTYKVQNKTGVDRTLYFQSLGSNQ